MGIGIKDRIASFQEVLLNAIWGLSNITSTAAILEDDHRGI